MEANLLFGMRQKIDCMFKNLYYKVFLADLKYKVRIKVHKIIMITVIGLIGISMAKSGPLAMLTNVTSYNNSSKLIFENSQY